jgi:hypothetical protein
MQHFQNFPEKKDPSTWERTRTIHEQRPNTPTPSFTKHELCIFCDPRHGIKRTEIQLDWHSWVMISSDAPIHHFMGNTHHFAQTRVRRTIEVVLRVFLPFLVISFPLAICLERRLPCLLNLVP